MSLGARGPVNWWLGMTARVDADTLSDLKNFSHGPMVGLALRF